MRSLFWFCLQHIVEKTGTEDKTRRCTHTFSLHHGHGSMLTVFVSMGLVFPARIVTECVCMAPHKDLQHECQHIVQLLVRVHCSCIPLSLPLLPFIGSRPARHSCMSPIADMLFWCGREHMGSGLRQISDPSGLSELSGNRPLGRHCS